MRMETNAICPSVSSRPDNTENGLVANSRGRLAERRPDTFTAKPFKT